MTLYNYIVRINDVKMTSKVIDTSESASKSGIASGVADWVEGWVEVAQPVAELPGNTGHRFSRRTRIYYQYIVRSP